MSFGYDSLVDAPLDDNMIRIMAKSYLDIDDEDIKEVFSSDNLLNGDQSAEFYRGLLGGLICAVVMFRFGSINLLPLVAGSVADFYERSEFV